MTAIESGDATVVSTCSLKVLDCRFYKSNPVSLTMPAARPFSNVTMPATGPHSSRASPLLYLSSALKLLLSAANFFKPACMIQFIRRRFPTRAHQVVVHPPRHAHRVIESCRSAAVAVPLARIDH